MAKLRAMTNLQVVEDLASATGYKLQVGPFPGTNPGRDGDLTGARVLFILSFR
jgi:hypothetical protein